MQNHRRIRTGTKKGNMDEESINSAFWMDFTDKVSGVSEHKARIKYVDKTELDTHLKMELNGTVLKNDIRAARGIYQLVCILRWYCDGNNFLISNLMTFKRDGMFLD